MDAVAQSRAMGLLGHFNDEMTRAFDEAMGTQWAEIEEMLTIATVAADRSVTTRQLAELTGLNRRAISRMIARLHADDLVETRPSAGDRRAVDVALSPRGERHAKALRTSFDDFFRRSTGIAREIRHGLGPVSLSPEPPAPADSIDLLRRACEAGLSLVRFLPDAALHGQLAARQRAALVQIVTLGGVRPNDLAASLGVSRAGAAYIADQLCAKGFAVRRRGSVPEDRRAVVLEPTADGVRVVRAVLDGIELQREPLSHLFAEIALWS